MNLYERAYWSVRGYKVTGHKNVTCKRCKGEGYVSVFQQDGIVFGLLGAVLFGTKDECQGCGGSGAVRVPILEPYEDWP